jgi:putative transposase
MLSAVKFRIFPTIQQQQALSQDFGNCRWLWNYLLNLTSQTYKESGVKFNKFELKKLLPILKVEFPWLKLSYSQSLQEVVLNLSTAFKNFFEHRTGFPKFKSKFGKQSIHFPQNVKILDNSIKFPKLGEIKAILHREITGKVKTVTISKNSSDQYFASVLIDDGKKVIQPNYDGVVIGIDLGLTDYITLSTGEKVSNPKHFKKYKKNQKRKQQQLSRKQKNSKNRGKARKKLAVVHRKIKNSREDFLHKLSRKIVNESQVIVVENLAIKSMVKNHKLANSISQASWGMFQTMLKYKAEKEGKVYLEVDRFFASSKTCNICLNKIETLPLSVRNWKCSVCNTEHDRDINAAINIRNEGLRKVPLEQGSSLLSKCKTKEVEILKSSLMGKKPTL